MRTATILAMTMAAAGATGASAQLLGGSGGVGAGAGVGIRTPGLGSTVGGATGAARDGVDAANTTGDAAIGRARNAGRVEVRAGVSTRVERGTRCYYAPDDYSFDPVYRDGGYYCERRGSAVGAAAGASVTAPR